MPFADIVRRGTEFGEYMRFEAISFGVYASTVASFEKLYNGLRLSATLQERLIDLPLSWGAAALAIGGLVIRGSANPDQSLSQETGAINQGKDL